MRALCDGAVGEPVACDPGKRLQAEVPGDALDRLGIAELASRPFHELSGGQRQLVIFARALV
jgi:iron complex transport system ATP-binding protein